MLNANAQDSARIELVTRNILKAAIATQKTQAFVKLRDFYAVCHLSKLPRNRFVDEVGDILTGTALVKEFGMWVIAEYGDGFHVLCKIEKEFDYEYKFTLPDEVAKKAARISDTAFFDKK